MVGHQNGEEMLNAVDADKAISRCTSFFCGNQGGKVEREKHGEESYGAK